MPNYEYECEKCKTIVEHFHSMSESPIYKCEKCGKVLKKLLGAGSGLIFKGSGFYETDYKKTSVSSKLKSSETTDSPVKKKSKTDSADKDSKPTSSEKTETKSTEKPKNNEDSKSS